MRGMINRDDIPRFSPAISYRFIDTFLAHERQI